MKKLLSLIITTLSVLVLTAVCFTSLAVSAPKTVSTITYTSTDSSVTLTWNNVKSTGYRVYKYNTSTKKWDSVVTTSKTTATVKSLKPGTKTIFAVKPYNKQDGNIAWAKTYTKITAATAPSTVTGLKATSAATDITLSWSKAKGATGYRIYLYNTSTKKWDIILKATNKTAVKVEGLTAGTSYLFAVKPYYNSGNGILWASTYTSLKTTTTPAKVTGVKVSAVKNNTATISWSKTTGAQRYYVYSYNAATKKYTLLGKTTSTSYTVEYLNPAKNNYFAVKAARFIGSTAYSGALSSRAKAPLTVYRDFLKSKTQYNKFYVLDINNDEINELIVKEAKYDYAEVYTYKNNTTITYLGRFNCYNNKFFYNTSQKAIGGQTVGANMFLSYQLYVMLDYNLKEIAYCSTAHGYDPNTYKDVTTYRIDNYGNKVSKSSYDTYYKAYFGSSKTYTFKDATSANIASYL